MFKLLIHIVLLMLVFCPLPGSAQDTTTTGPNLALVLGGGGARGAAHIGVLKVLERNNIKPDLVVGNSMGALVGALYCAGVPVSQIEEMFVSGKIRKAFRPRPLPVQLMMKAPMASLKICGIRRTYPGVFSGKSVEKFIDSLLPESKKNIEDLDIPLAVIVTDLGNGQAYRLTKGNLARALRASSSLPPAIQPIEIEGRIFADGGLRANVPTVPARAMGAKHIIAVETDAKMHEIDKDQLKSIAGLLDRVASIGLSIIDEYHLQKADFVISPKIDNISVFSFSKENAKIAIQRGEEAAEQQLSKLQQFMETTRTAAMQSPSL